MACHAERALQAQRRRRRRAALLSTYERMPSQLLLRTPHYSANGHHSAVVSWRRLRYGAVTPGDGAFAVIIINISYWEHYWMTLILVSSRITNLLRLRDGVKMRQKALQATIVAGAIAAPYTSRALRDTQHVITMAAPYTHNTITNDTAT